MLVLWDIDHTLINTRGVGRELSALAFEQVNGCPMERQAKIDGMTEAVIFRETATLHGITVTRGDFERFARALTAAHHEHADRLREHGHALPGAANALAALAAEPGVVQTVLTGNVRGVAEVKLCVFGLDRHIRWDLGAYGEDHDERAELVKIALTRASTVLGRTVTPTSALIIGDTPADVEAGRAAGVPVIGIATGHSTADDLTTAGARTVMHDLTDTEHLLRVTRGQHQRP
jgi:phosphoglycolate phosphatase-like HAD superfamily hydrolase